MSQNSLVLATAGTLSGLAAVEAVNAALDTLNTLGSGASPPSAPEAGQFWHDTGNNLLKLRSVDNTAWIVVGAIDETNHVFSAATRAAPSIYGLTMANDTTAPATIIDVATGGAYDSTAALYMRLTSALRKNVTTAWAAGTGNGALDTGSFQASKFYHVHLIYNAVSGASDIVTSLSYGSPALPAGYGYFVPIGAVFSNASANVMAFTQNGNEFIPATGSYDFNGAPPLAATLLSLHVPTGCKVRAKLRLVLNNGNSGSTTANVLVYSPDEGTQAPTNPPAGDGNATISTYANALAATEISVLTNTAGEVTIIASQSTSVDFSAYLRAFEYPRGLQ